MASILIVDDDPTARDLLVTVLGYGNHQTREAIDGAEGLIKAQAERADLIIVDLLMPTMDGFEFVRRLRAMPTLASTPVVFYTASYLVPEVLNLAKACGVSEIITKPAEPEQIFQVVNNVLGVSRPPVPSPTELPSEEFRRENINLLTAKLSQKAAHAVPRLEAMIELGLKLASERNPQRLLSSFCGATRKIIGAKYAVVGVLDKNDNKLSYPFASGMSPEIAAQLSAPHQQVDVSDAALSARQSRRLHALPGDPQIVGLPAEHPPVHSFLCAPIVSPERLYGWVFLADKIGAPEFNEEDEALSQILAAQVGRIYENGSLYAEVKRYVQQLEAEVAERKRAQDDIRKLNVELERRVAERTAELEAANRELEAFSYSVSHDLRAPLRAVSGYTEILLENYRAALPPDAQHVLRNISEGAERMGQLIDDLLAFAHLSRQPLRRRQVDATALVQKILDELQGEDDGRRIDVRLEPLPPCLADGALLRQVWTNLLSNAFKFTRKREHAMIAIGWQQQAQEKAYFVSDNGAGFDMRYADKLFGVFQRLHSATDFEGTGIGLSIAQRIIHRHGGRIWGQSAAGEGATFYFTLPAPPNTP